MGWSRLGSRARPWDPLAPLQLKLTKQRPQRPCRYGGCVGQRVECATPGGSAPGHPGKQPSGKNRRCFALCKKIVALNAIYDAYMRPFHSIRDVHFILPSSFNSVFSMIVSTQHPVCNFFGLLNTCSPGFLSRIFRFSDASFWWEYNSPFSAFCRFFPH